MKKIPLLFVTAFALIAVSLSCGCVPNRVKKEAEANKIQYEDAFREKVAEELGPDYTLRDVEGRIRDFGGPVTVFSPSGRVSKGSRYMADDALEGKLEHNGEVYDIEYYWLTDKMSTNALYTEIAYDYAVAGLGLDRDKILYIHLYDPESDNYIIGSDIRTAAEFFEVYGGSQWFIVIATEEDLSDKDFEDFQPVCHENEAYGFVVSIYSSDNMTNLDDFKEHYRDIRWSNPKISNQKPSLAYVPDDESDIYARYNLKKAVQISYTKENRHGNIFIY